MDVQCYSSEPTDDALIGIPGILDKYMLKEIYPKNLIAHKLNSKIERCRKSITNVERRISEGEDQLSRMIKLTRTKINLCDDKINEIKRILYT